MKYDLSILFYIEKGKIENKIVQDKITRPLLYVNASIIVLGIIFVIIFAITNIQQYKDNFNSYNKGKPQNQVEQSK